ncbi:hypothetical protein [Lignipirellula cremea]|uniref:Uncharacterized protein n=1 Tax=Lignipirellula cremea TaxID=2528010 RepID=A0A518E0S8_9BACT|nr:hypothetical protein [Lignipirellula cremea]QDU97694.1 hypothetical protein Pla8534_55470 [Lignipirellula cremea]
MMTSVKKYLQVCREFHQDEDGEQAMSTVMVLGVAALVVVALIAVGVFIFKAVKPYLTNAVKDGGFETP